MQYIRQFFQILLTPLRVLVTSPQQLIATPRRLLGLSLAARISILLAIFLLVVVAAVAWVAWRSPDEVLSARIVKLSAAFVLAIVIPIVAYPVLKLWLEGETSAFEDIDRAWNAGIAELERNGLDLTRLPLFLAIGSSGELHERKLFEASRLSLTIGPFPQGAAALHWYATDKAVYLVASEVGNLSKVATVGESVVEEERKRQLTPAPAAPVGAAPFNPHGGTLEIKVPDLRETIATPPPAAAPLPPPGPVGRPDYRGTMMLVGESVAASGATSPGPAALDKMPIRLSREDREAQPLRLRYLCQLIRRARQPYCPINGLLTLLPYNVIQRGGSDATEVQTSVQADLATLTQSFRLRFPAIAVVTGLERESGFRELIRRVGFERARLQRFGKGFRVWDQATPEQLGALCLHACGAFELFIYELFREKDSLTNPDKAPGNRKLYTLLCQIRRDFQKRLDRILADGYAHDSDRNGRASPILFGGCYFAATGPNEATQAFTQSVFERLLEEQEELEWHPSILREDTWFRRLSFACFALDAGLLAAVAVISYFKHFR
ncbi:MAG TPA: type VI secretion protein IcmF/TssM N-terminal domain-containing protein [Pirellulales bacterium]|jgi:hypothetical protein|nr:type VI secretion protein IcmF/TssM N-terminal domain-containing protein [Pirellulales bacterium]